MLNESKFSISSSRLELTLIKTVSCTRCNFYFRRNEHLKKSAGHNYKENFYQKFAESLLDSRSQIFGFSITNGTLKEKYIEFKQLCVTEIIGFDMWRDEVKHEF